MALVVKDRVLETSNTNGTGTFTLAGAVNGFQAFSVIGVGNTTYYAITEETNNQWEVGLGTVGSETLTRDTVLSSSNSGNKVDFADGLKQVFCDYPASKAVTLDSSGNSLYGGNSYENFSSIAAPTYSEGRLWYDSTQKTLAYYNDVTNNLIHIGQEVQVKVINNTGSTIAIGSPVYVTSTSSGQSYPNVALAKADVQATSTVLGLTTQAITNGSTGYVTTVGILQPCNTGTFTVGDVLYLSPYSAGQLMNTVPPTGYAVQVGIVAYSNSPNGSIYVRQAKSYVTAAQIVGTVAVANGGTGQSSALIAGAVVYGSSTTAMGVTAAGTIGQVLTSAGTGTPTWTTPATGTVTSVSGTGTVSGISLSGTVTSSGNLTLGGTLDLSSPPTIGNTAANTGSFTTLIGGGSSANYGQLTGGATTKAVEFKTLGSDTNVGLAIRSQGTGAIDLAAGSSGVNISNGGTVTAITRTAGGTGYTVAPTITISAPTTAGGVQATATCTVTAGVVDTAFTITNAGSGYVEQPTITFTPVSGGSGATAYATVGGTSIVRSLGQNLDFYTPNNTSTPSFRVLDNQSAGTGQFISVRSSSTTPLLLSSAALNISSTSTNNVSIFTNANSQEQLRVSHTASAVNYVQVTGAATASKVVAISAQGSDTDVTLSLSPKGAGTIRFGTYTGTILTPTGYITITDSGGTSRRLLVG